jgi:hypothetical protein
MAHVFGSGYTRQQLQHYVGSMEQLAGFEMAELSDGAGRGVRTARMHNSSGLALQVLIDRGLDLSGAQFLGVPLAWVSSTGPTNPAYYDSRGMGWLRGFHGGLLMTCGLSNVGPAEVDNGEELGLHGRLSNLPAQHVTYGGFWEGDDYTVFLQGEVRETRVFGENLLLKRQIRARLGEPRIIIEDTVVNEGYQSSPHMLLYHINAGFPLVTPGTCLKAPSLKVTARDEDALAGLNEHAVFEMPSAGYREQVFYHTMQADEDGFVRVDLHSAVSQCDKPLGMYVRYRQAELPCFVEWKMMGQGVYAVGLEPATNLVSGRSKERERDALTILKPGEQRSYYLEIGMCNTRSELLGLT